MINLICITLYKFIFYYIGSDREVDFIPIRLAPHQEYISESGILLKDICHDFKQARFVEFLDFGKNQGDIFKLRCIVGPGIEQAHDMLANFAGSMAGAGAGNFFTMNGNLNIVAFEIVSDAAG
jgi:hypothetical protein